MDKFTTSLGTGLAVSRAIYYYAYVLDRYRQSGAAYAFILLSYVWLLVVSVVSLSLINEAILSIAPTQFRFASFPSAFVVVRYSLASMVLNTIAPLDASGDWANGVNIAAALLGVVFLGTVLINLYTGHRQRHQDDELTAAVAALKEQSAEVERRIAAEYEVTPEEAVERLREIKENALALFTFLSSRIPRDF